MSLNHLIDPLQNPKLDLYVEEIETQGLVVDNFAEINGDVAITGFLSVFDDGNGTIVSDLVASNKYVNYQNRFFDKSYATNDFIFNSPLYVNGWSGLGNVKTFIEVSDASSSFQPYIETYHITFEGTITNNAPSVFEFRSREGFDDIMDIKCQIINANGVGDGVYSSVGCVLLPADDVLNDFQFRVSPVSNFSTPIVPPATSGGTMSITIKVLINPL